MPWIRTSFCKAAYLNSFKSALLILFPPISAFAERYAEITCFCLLASEKSLETMRYLFHWIKARHGRDGWKCPRAAARRKLSSIYGPIQIQSGWIRPPKPNFHPIHRKSGERSHLTQLLQCQSSVQCVLIWFWRRRYSGSCFEKEKRSDPIFSTAVSFF